ncbi:MAG: energy transducer TonB [Desulfobacterales bacterium]|nr:energy transducer TonB [Desulfobacterales bacterium]
MLESATPHYDRNPPPDYPRRARQLGFEGTVLLDVAVNTQGGVDAVAVAASSGYAMLDEAALGAVRHWIFKPARQEGRPVADRVLVPVRFVLSASSAAGK